jgi:hypothetical protein
MAPTVYMLQVYGECCAQNATKKWTRAKIAKNAIALTVRDPGAEAFVRCRPA